MLHARETPKPMRQITKATISFIPGAATIAEGLFALKDLCEELSEAGGTCTAVYDRLNTIYEELERIEEAGGLQNQHIDRFTRTLEVYWRYLEGFKSMNPVQRFFHHGKFKKAIANIILEVDELFQMVGLANARFQVEWKQQYDLDMRGLLNGLLEFMVSAADLQGELRAREDKRDALIMLRAESEKIDRRASNLPTDSQYVVKQAYKTVVGFSGGHVDATPDWFLAECDVDFDVVPFATGSMATVHKGMLYGHTEIVVKMVRATEGGLDASLQPSFMQEANLWWTLNHPHVARLVGACHVSRRPLLVSERAANGNMTEFLRSSPSHRNFTWHLLYEAAQGIAYLHSKNIIHGDIRLSNVLVTENNKALITDFGMSRIKRKSKSKSMSTRKDGQEVKGNWRWMAPECFTHMPQFESDVYGMAMIILEAYNGEPPYADVKEEAEVKALILKSTLPVRPRGMSNRVWTLIEQMTKKHREERIKITEVVNALKEFAKTEPAPPASTVEDVLLDASSLPPLAAEDIQRLVTELKDGKTAVNAAKQLCTFTKQPTSAQSFGTSATIRALIACLECSKNADVKENVAQVIGNVAKDTKCAQRIGAGGGILVLVELLSTGCDRVQISASRALILLLSSPLNCTMFIQADGIQALQTRVETTSDYVLSETLGFVKDMVSTSAELARAIAANTSILHVCLEHTRNDSSKAQENAGAVLQELARQDGKAVDAIDRFNGFDTLPKDTLLLAIKTLLREKNRSIAQPDVGPQQSVAALGA